MSTTRINRYQEGTIDRVARSKGPDAWVYRWRELQEDGRRVQRKKTIGDIDQFPTKADVKREVENLRSEINARQVRIGKTTVSDGWGHFQLHELRDPDVGRSPTTIKNYLAYFKVQILPTWKDVPLDDVKSVAVEKWLRSLDLANGTKAKIRNLMSALFSHCIRHELYDKLNPIASVRQGSVRQSDPDILTIGEMKAIINGIDSEVIRVMVAVATASALRRSELRGLKWADLNFESLWFHLRRGVVNKDETKLKTKASRKGVPMNPELAEMLQAWRSHSPYPTDEDWVFASPFTEGKRPYWPDAALKNHVRPAARAAGITKNIGWHTFRHSVGTHLGQSGENVKVVQELLRHASSRITQDVYQQADQGAKRSALSRFSGMLALPAKKPA